MYYYNLLTIFLMSMLPIGELRFSIPMGIHQFEIEWYNAWLFSVLGNSFVTLILIFFISYYGIEKIKYFINKIIFIGFIFKKWENSSIKKSKKIQKWGYVGLISFVGLPLPVTGAWTAVLIAFFLDLKPFKSFISILLGLMISGTIVTLISVYLPQFFGYN